MCNAAIFLRNNSSEFFLFQIAQVPQLTQQQFFFRRTSIWLVFYESLPQGARVVQGAGAGREHPETAAPLFIDAVFAVAAQCVQPYFLADSVGGLHEKSGSNTLHHVMS